MNARIDETGFRPRRARISLVGAGPGDPELLTVRAYRLLRSADVVIADRLVPTPILDLVRGRLRIARKPRGRAQAGQRELEAWTLEAAQAGHHVVRLKTGNPFIYGRATEELDAFSEAGFEVEVVPGLSSATAAPIAAGIPLTMRGVADRFTVLTGQGNDGRWVDPPDHRPDETLVWLMAVSRAGIIADQLIARGWPPSTPVAIVERASHPDERVTTATLLTLGATIAAAKVRAPAVIVVGEVAAYAPAAQLDALPALLRTAVATVEATP